MSDVEETQPESQDKNNRTLTITIRTPDGEELTHENITAFTLTGCCDGAFFSESVGDLPTLSLLLRYAEAQNIQLPILRQIEVSRLEAAKRAATQKIITAPASAIPELNKLKLSR